MNDQGVPPVPPVPIGLQLLLQAAASDAALLERIIAGRAAAALQAGFELTSSERAILETTSAGQLRQMAEAFSAERAPGGQLPDRPKERMPTTGILAADRPEPAERIERAPLVGGARPDRPERHLVSRGIQSDRPGGGRTSREWLILALLAVLSITLACLVCFAVLALRSDAPRDPARGGERFAEGRVDDPTPRGESSSSLAVYRSTGARCCAARG